MEYCLRIADLDFGIQIPHRVHIGKNFAPFLVDSLETALVADFCPVEELKSPRTPAVYEEVCFRIHEENGVFRRTFRVEPEATVPYAVAEFWPSGVRVSYLSDYGECFRELGQCFAHLGLESLLLEHDRLCLHAACVNTTIGGILFAGPSGIGKSTQAELWEKFRGGVQINGDRPILNCKKDRWLAWGSPYAGSSGVHVNENCPIRAIVMLEQSTQCAIRRLGHAEAFRKVYSCITVNQWDIAAVTRACDLTQELVESVAVYELACTPDLRAVETLEREIGEDGQ